MITPDQIAQLQQLLETAQIVLVLVSPASSVDQLAAAGGWAAMVRQAGKEVILACPVQPDPAAALETYHSLKTKLGYRNLTISFDYAETAVDKVSYHIGEESGKFFLTIKPQKDHPPLDKSTVELDYTGAEADLIFVVGVSDYEQLDQLYFANEKLFADTPVVSIHNYETSFGVIKLDISGVGSMSGAVTQLGQQLGLTPTDQAATDLLLGIETATDNFQSLATTPEIFEMVAWLMRLGARRKKKAAAQTAQFAEVFSKKAQADSSSPTEVVVVPSPNPNKPAPKAEKTDQDKDKKDEKAGGLDHQPSLMSKSN